MAKRTKKATPGPKPARVKIEGDWEAAMERAIKTPKPAEGWPKPKAMPQRARKRKPGK